MITHPEYPTESSIEQDNSLCTTLCLAGRDLFYFSILCFQTLDTH